MRIAIFSDIHANLPALDAVLTDIGRRQVDERACYAILDAAAATPVRFVRVEYDLAAVTDAIRRSDLPLEFADDLEHGGAPAKVQS